MSIYQKNKKEIRTTPCRLSVKEMRESAPAGESRVIEGVAIVFGPEYRVKDIFGDTYVERISPEAVTTDWLKTQDVKLNLLHERNATIARCNKGKGNLQMSVEKDGLHFNFEAPACDLGDRALALVRAGVYSGCSFEFYPQDYEVKETQDASGDTVTEVTHTRFESLSALTIAMDPAYEETSVTVRELLKKMADVASAQDTARSSERAEEAAEHSAAEERWYLREEEKLLRLKRRERMNRNRYC